MGDRRQPLTPPPGTRRPTPPPAPPPRQDTAASRELDAAHRTLDRFGVGRHGTDSIDRRGRASVFTRSVSQRIEEMARGLRGSHGD